MSTLQSAGALLKDARMRAGLTQEQTAQASGLTQSVISAYESGGRQPSVPVLLRLIEATGHRVNVDLVTAPPVPRPLAGPVGRLVVRHRSRLRRVAAQHGVTNPCIFGSVARGDDRPDSDVDLLVDLPAGASLFALGRLRTDLEAVVGVSVDVVPIDGLKPAVESAINRDLLPL